MSTLACSTAPSPPIPTGSRVHVCHIMSGDLWAGAEVQVATVASYLVERPDVKLAAVLFNDGWLANELRRLGVEVAVIDEARHNVWQIVSGLSRFLRARAVDVIHTHRNKDTVLGAIAARWSGVPHLVRTVHGLPEPMRGWDRLKYAAYEALDRAALWTAADRIIAVSARTADALKHSGYRRRAVMHIHNGIDLQQVRIARARDEVRRMLGVDAGAFVVGTAGRFVPVKGHEHLVRAAALIVKAVEGARVLLIGSGPREQQLRALARNLGVADACVFWNAAVDRRATMYDLLAALDVFVLPSLSEGLPMALLEAMALGKPVVASAVGGIPEVVTDHATGLLVRPGDERALAGACLELANNPARAGALAARGRRVVETHFSRERNGEQLLDLYRIVARRPGPPVGVAALAAAPVRAVASRARQKIIVTMERRRWLRLRRQPIGIVARLRAARHVLLVCHGNIIRSPFAAGLIAHGLGDPPAVAVASAGLDAEAGRRSPLLATRAAAVRGVDLRNHAARRLTPDHVAQADAIFVMDAPQLVAMRRQYPEAHDRTFLLTCLAADTPLEVQDPVNGDALMFQRCYDHISRAVQPLVRVLSCQAR